jgi:hypothetical protein
MGVTFQVERMARLMKELLGRNVSAKAVPTLPSASGPTVTASYTTDNGQLVAVCICDLELILNGGAALCLIPASEAANNLKAKRLDPALLENFKEVLNICAQLFGSSDAQRVKLNSLYLANADMPEELKTFMTKGHVRKEVQLSITGYGNGRLSVFC